MNKKEMQELAASVRLEMDTWSPGDGVTRYRFGHGSPDYFGMRASFTALGRKEAEQCLWAYVSGYRDRATGGQQ